MGEMKTLLIATSLALAGIGSAHAQMFQPSAARGAVLGAVAGSLIGGHNHDRWAEGAALGAVAGAIFGAAVGPQQPVAYEAPPVYRAAPPVVYRDVYGNVVPVVESVPCAPTVVTAPGYEQGQAPVRVVYVESAPRVVYVQPPPPRVVYVAPPVVSFGFGYSSGPRYYGGHRYYGHEGYRR